MNNYAQNWIRLGSLAWAPVSNSAGLLPTATAIRSRAEAGPTRRLTISIEKHADAQPSVRLRATRARSSTSCKIPSPGKGRRGECDYDYEHAEQRSIRPAMELAAAGR